MPSASGTRRPRGCGTCRGLRAEQRGLAEAARTAAAALETRAVGVVLALELANLDGHLVAADGRLDEAGLLARVRRDEKDREGAVADREAPADVAARALGPRQLATARASALFVFRS